MTPTKYDATAPGPNRHARRALARRSVINHADLAGQNAQRLCDDAREHPDDAQKVIAALWLKYRSHLPDEAELERYLHATYPGIADRMIAALKAFAAERQSAKETT
jgi:hypothetical protein